MVFCVCDSFGVGDSAAVLGRTGERETHTKRKTNTAPHERRGVATGVHRTWPTHRPQPPAWQRTHRSPLLRASAPRERPHLPRPAISAWPHSSPRHTSRRVGASWTSTGQLSRGDDVAWAGKTHRCCLFAHQFLLHRLDLEPLCIVKRELHLTLIFLILRFLVCLPSSGPH